MVLLQHAAQLDDVAGGVALALPLLLRQTLHPALVHDLLDVLVQVLGLLRVQDDLPLAQSLEVLLFVLQSQEVGRPVLHEEVLRDQVPGRLPRPEPLDAVQQQLSLLTEQGVVLGVLPPLDDVVVGPGAYLVLEPVLYLLLVLVFQVVHLDEVEVGLDGVVLLSQVVLLEPQQQQHVLQFRELAPAGDGLALLLVDRQVEGVDQGLELVQQNADDLLPLLEVATDDLLHQVSEQQQGALVDGELYLRLALQVTLVLHEDLFHQVVLVLLLRQVRQVEVLQLTHPELGQLDLLVFALLQRQVHALYLLVPLVLHLHQHVVRLEFDVFVRSQQNLLNEELDKYLHLSEDLLDLVALHEYLVVGLVGALEGEDVLVVAVTDLLDLICRNGAFHLYII